MSLPDILIDNAVEIASVNLPQAVPIGARALSGTVLSRHVRAVAGGMGGQTGVDRIRLLPSCRLLALDVGGDTVLLPVERAGMLIAYSPPVEEAPAEEEAAEVAKPKRAR